MKGARFTEQAFTNSYKSLVVLANPKTILNAKYAIKECKDQVIRADQIINTIKMMNKNTEGSFSEKDMKELAEFFLKENKQERSDYSKKYEELVNEVSEKKSAAPSEAELKCPRCGASLVLLIATKGDNAGKQFYGCSSFPKC